MILVEPALKLDRENCWSRARVLLAAESALTAPWLQVLLPCLGHQACGALAASMTGATKR